MIATLHVPASLWVGFLPLSREAGGDMFKCCFRLKPKKTVHWGNKGSEFSTLFKSGVEVLLLLLLLGGLQALLGDFGLVVGGVSIHDMHVMNTVRPLLSEVYYEEISLQISLVLWKGPFYFSFPLRTARPVYILVSSRTWVGVKVFLTRLEIPSHSSLWHAVMRPPLLQSRAWQM